MKRERCCHFTRSLRLSRARQMLEGCAFYEILHHGLFLRWLFRLLYYLFVFGFRVFFLVPSYGARLGLIGRGFLHVHFSG